MKYFPFIAILVIVLLAAGCMKENAKVIEPSSAQTTVTITVPSTITKSIDKKQYTDFKITALFISSSESSTFIQVWIENIGTEKISLTQIQKADVLCGVIGNYSHLVYQYAEPDDVPNLPNGQWTENFIPSRDLNSNGYWDPGETIRITTKTTKFPSGSKIVFKFTLPNGVWRSTEFIAD